MDERLKETVAEIRRLIEHEIGKGIEGEPFQEKLTGILDSLLSAQNGGWRTIDSAPKDGTEVLLAFQDGRRVIGFWEPYFAEGGMQFDSRYQPWAETFSGDRLHNHYGAPTHWMPLPSPPTPESKDKGDGLT